MRWRRGFTHCLVLMANAGSKGWRVVWDVPTASVRIPSWHTSTPMCRIRSHENVWHGEMLKSGCPYTSLDITAGMRDTRLAIRITLRTVSAVGRAF